MSIIASSQAGKTTSSTTASKKEAPRAETKAHSGPHISIKAEPLFHIGSFQVTNALVTSWLVVVFLIFLAVNYTRNNQIRQFFNLLLKNLHGLFKNVFGKNTDKYFPFVMTFFMYILFSNWLGLLPGVGTILVQVGDEGKLPLFRAATADLNTTLALGFLSIFMIQVFSIKELGFGKYLKKFINLSNPINAFVGILEIMSEFSKAISFSFRLFGNIFAGEVLLTVVAFLVPALASFPFLVFEFFVGFIQALVFSMLTAIFLSVAVTEHSH